MTGQWKLILLALRAGEFLHTIDEGDARVREF